MIAQEAIPEAVPVEIVNEEDVPVESVDEAPTDTVTLEDAPKDVQTEDAATESVQEPAPVFEEQIVDEPVVKQKAVEPVTVEEKTVEPVTVETVIVEEKTVEPVIEAPAVIEDKTVEEPVEKPKSKPHADKRLSFRPLARKLSQGPPVAISSITAQVFKTNPVLEEVLLSLEMIEKNDPSMDHFDIKDFQFFSSAHVQSLAASLITNTHLKKINMSNVKLSTPDCVILAKALAKNEGVEILNLESNQIGPQGMRELALALGTNKSLQQLLLSHQSPLPPLVMMQSSVSPLHSKRTQFSRSWVSSSDLQLIATKSIVLSLATRRLLES
ncbi:hypothetical protein EDD86DRAFT_101884 [Gorgonomyces haynaldii]|nr:hypothetical protein EDD86DRAFT_101884 [Gorgonomyces haynaldii]